MIYACRKSPPIEPDWLVQTGNDTDIARIHKVIMTILDLNQTYSLLFKEEITTCYSNEVQRNFTFCTTDSKSQLYSCSHGDMSKWQIQHEILLLLPTNQISGSQSFTRWLAPGSELGASWSEGSKPNVILGFRVPTTIGLRKPPAGSPYSQLAPFAPARFQLSPASQLAPAHSSLLPFLQLSPASQLASLAPACSPCSQLSPVSQLAPACSQLSSASQLALAHSPCSSSLPMANVCVGVRTTSGV